MNPISKILFFSAALFLILASGMLLFRQESYRSVGVLNKTSGTVFFRQENGEYRETAFTHVILWDSSMISLKSISFCFMG
jgi:hypothetical protein